MSENLANLTKAGVSIWLDDLSRDRLATGNLKELIANSKVRGVTTNPAIFSSAIGKSKLYQNDIETLTQNGFSLDQIIELLTTHDVANACDLFSDLYHESNGIDGRVSIEVEPELAYETSATISRAIYLYQKVSKENLLVKVPATSEGLSAIEYLTSEGISINVTLIFSLDRYLEVMESYIRGLEKRIAKNLPINNIHSVASFFISRIDSEVDKRLDAIAANHPLRGKIAIANAILAYQAFTKVFTSNRWQVIANAGGNIQRPLWASTGVKDPAYPQDLYVTELICPNTVNTMPQATLDYIRDHHSTPNLRINPEQAIELMAQLKAIGIDLQEVTQKLESEGVEKFQTSWLELKEKVKQEMAGCITLVGGATKYFNPNSPTTKELNKAAPKIIAKDSNLWGKAAQAEASIRLGWLDLPAQYGGLKPELEKLKEFQKANDLNNIVLCGMGGSSLAPEVFAKVFNKKLTVLDTTDPSQISNSIPKDLSNTVVIVSSKSGSTVETASQRAYFESLFTKSNLEISKHMVIVTDPGSPLDQDARSKGLTVINANPNVGGRYSALSAFGLVPATLMGIDLDPIMQSASQILSSIANENSPVIKLATILTDFNQQNVAFIDEGSNLPGIADWIEQLIAESTGKSGKGRLPIVLESDSAPVAGNVLKIFFEENAPIQNSQSLLVKGGLGSQFIFWEFVTALLGKALKVDPFNQPNVAEAKERTLEVLNSPASTQTPDYEDNDLQIFGAKDFNQVLTILRNDGNSHYLAIMAYLNRIQDVEIAKLRRLLASKLNIGCTFGWGPRFLHSTGQFHKGGQLNGSFLQITSDSELDLEIPGKEFTFHQLQMAQAIGDGKALSSRNFPVIRIHLKNKNKAISKLLKALT